jgi:hypothetical protein
MPKSAHPAAKRALAEIWNAEDRDQARRAVAAFKLAYGAKFGTAVAMVRAGARFEHGKLVGRPLPNRSPPGPQPPDQVSRPVLDWA